MSDTGGKGWGSAGGGNGNIPKFKLRVRILRHAGHLEDSLSSPVIHTIDADPHPLFENVILVF